MSEFTNRKAYYCIGSLGGIWHALAKNKSVASFCLYCTALPAGCCAGDICGVQDPKGDDAGAGGLLYPAHGVYVPGLFDLLQFSLSSDSDHLYFDFQFAALTNPFQAPEGYFHQRLEVYVHTGTRLGRTEVEIGGWTFQTAPELGWDLRLSVALRRDQALRRWRRKPGAGFSEGVTSYSRPENGTIRVQVSSDLLPSPTQPGVLMS